MMCYDVVFFFIVDVCLSVCVCVDITLPAVAVRLKVLEFSLPFFSVTFLLAPQVFERLDETQCKT